MRIRKYQEKDKKQVRELIESILREIFKKKPKNLEDLDNIKVNYNLFLVAEDKGKSTGTIGLIKKANLGVLRRFFVKKEFRERGIGKKLYDTLENFAKKTKIEKLILSTSPQMKEAIRFYQKNNFLITKITKNKIYMEKKWQK